ncbi:hypothetical protein D9M69_450360 [compost metagenome]
MISIPEGLSDTLALLPGPELRSGRYCKHVTFLPSRKNGGAVACETLLEADFCLELERLTFITAYEAQPFTLTLKKGRKRYTPDFAAKLRDGTIVLYEIKPDNALNDALTYERLCFFRSLFAECGYALECVRESQFRHPIKTLNLQILYQQSMGATRQTASVVNTLINATPQKKLSVQELIADQASRPDIAYAVFYRLVLANLFRPFSLNTQLRCRKEQ